MAIRFVTPDGFEFICDSAQEAADAYGMISKTAAVPHTQDHGVRAERVAQKRNGVSLGSFALRKKRLTLEDLPEIGQSIARALIENPDGLSSDSLAQASGIQTTNLPPIIRALRSTLEGAGLIDPLVRQKYFDERRPKSWYTFSTEVLSWLSQE